MDDLDGFADDDPLVTWDILLDAVRDPAFIHDPNGCLMRFNQPYLECCEEPPEAIIGRPYWLVFPKRERPLHSCRTQRHHDHESRPEEQQAVEDLLLESGERVRSHALPLFDAEGRFCYALHILARPSDYPHPVFGARFLRASMEQSANPTALLDATGHITHANPALMRLVNMDGEQIPGRPLARLGFSVEGVDDIDTLPVLLRRHGHWQGALSHQSRAGQTVIWRTSITTVRDPNGQVAGFTAILFCAE